MEAIRLKKDSKIVLDTTFSDVKRKGMTEFITDREISHDLLVDLLDLLKGINSIDKFLNRRIRKKMLFRE